MSCRSDISPWLIHFTKGDSDEAVFNRLKKIIKERRLIGGTGYIKGAYQCVCFSEAPIEALKEGLVNPERYSRYSSFGIMVSKEWIFSNGGRPVIYQPEGERKLLQDEALWRHALYEIRDGFSRSDYTWEREWRLCCESLLFDQALAKIVVPTKEWITRLKSDHDDDEDYTVRQYSTIFGEVQAEQYREPFSWEVIALG